MGASSSSLAGVISHYADALGGKPRALVAVHLIVTPEYVNRMTQQFPDLHIFAIRLDRGLSDAETLQTPPGTTSRSSTLAIHYIVPLAAR